MLSKSTFRLVCRTLKLIRRTQQLENGVCGQFGPTSDNAAQANSTTREALALFMTLMDGFKEGLRLNSRQTYNLSLMMPIMARRGEEAEALSAYLRELTEGFCASVVPEEDGGCTLNFNRTMTE